MFRFRQFAIEQDRCAMKVGTDGVLLGAWARVGEPVPPSPRILDIGTGTGVVALMMAQRYPDAMVDAVEIDQEAFSQAEENVKRSPFSSRMKIFHSSVQDFSSSCVWRYDAIVSNPPYFQHALKNPDNRKALARHTDTLTYADLLTVARNLLSNGGLLSVILPYGDCLSDFVEQSVYQGFYVSREVRIKTTERKSPKRCLLELSRQAYHGAVTEVQCLSDGRNVRSEWYAMLTKDFYL